MLNKLKYFILTFLSVFFTFINSSAIDNIKLNASSSSEIMFMEKISDNYFTEKSVDKGFVEDFICSQKTTNSKLHFENDYISSEEMYYHPNDLSDYMMKWNPTYIFHDVFYENYSYNNDYGIYSIGNHYLNGEFPDYILEANYIGGDRSEVDHLGFVYDDVFQKEVKRGFSDINGVSLISNDIYLNTSFNEMLMENNNIDLALCNTSSYNIDWVTQLNRVCYNLKKGYDLYLSNLESFSYLSAFDFQFPLIKVDGDEYVNVVFSPFGAYIVTHNCTFSISSNGKEIYLSLPYMNYIEKVTVSVPFFTGSFCPFLTSNSPDGTYATAYMVGPEIINEIQEVMTSFVPKLWNNDSRNVITKRTLFSGPKYINLYQWNPYQVYDLDKTDNKVVFRSNVDLNVNFHSFTLSQTNPIYKKTEKIVCGDFISKNILNTFDYSAYQFQEYSEDIYYSYNCDFSTMNFIYSSNIEVDCVNYVIVYNDLGISQYFYERFSNVSAFNESAIDSRLNFSNTIDDDVNNQHESQFMYVVDQTAKIIHGKYRYHTQTNPSFWEEIFGGEPYWIVNNVKDENNSRREFVYLDFFWDSALNNKINNIDSVYIVLPKYNDKKIESIIIEKDNIISCIENPMSEAWSFVTYYESQVDGYYHFFGMPNATGMFYDESTLNGALTYFDDYNCRFMYSHYNGQKGEESIHRLADELIADDSTSCFAQLKVIVDADTIVKCTTAENGLHIEYDDTGNLKGIYDQYGNLREEYSVDDDGYIVNTETGEKPTNYYDYKNIQKYHDENYEKWLSENTFWGKFKSFFTNIGDFFTEGGFKSVIIGLLSVVGVVIVVFVGVKIKKVISVAKMKGDVKKIKNKPRKKVKKRKK